MIYIALRMLWSERPKYAGLVFGITFTSFLVTFAASYFAGFMTQGFSLITENPAADVWVMDPAVNSVEQTTNLPRWALERVRSVAGVQSAMPLVLGSADARFPGGRVQPFQIIGVDDATLSGAPVATGFSPTLLRKPGAVIVDPGGTRGKLVTPLRPSDRWPHDHPRPDVPARELASGDELQVNDQRVLVVGRARGLPRYPPRPLMYTTVTNAERLLAPGRRPLTFVLAVAAPGIPPRALATRIEAATGLRARSSADFKEDTFNWILINAEDVGDIAAMLAFALTIGLGVTGVMLYMFTQENLRQYAVLSAMGTTPRTLLIMIFAQAGFCALVGTGLGMGLCGIASELARGAGYPFRMMWLNLLLAAVTVLAVSVVAALVSARPLLKLQPVDIFSGR